MLPVILQYRWGSYEDVAEYYSARVPSHSNVAAMFTGWTSIYR